MAAYAAVDPEDRRILDLDGYVHVVDGTVLCFERHMFSLSTGSDREVLFRIAGNMRGRDGVCVLADPGDDSGNYMAETRDIGSFPEPLRAAIRRARLLHGC